MKEIQNFLDGFGGRVLLLIFGAIASGFSGYASSQLSTIQENQTNLANKVMALQTSDAVTSANKFTASDWKDASLVINERFHTLDMRITKLEESSKAIAESLNRIEANLGTK